MVKWTLRKFADKEILGQEGYIEWLRELGLLSREYECPKCLVGVKMQRKAALQDGYVWRCGKCKCTRSIRSGSWFAGSKMSLQNIMLMTYMWAVKYPSGIIIRETGFSEHTVVDWKNFCREAASKIVDEVDFEQLGGVGEIVEIDETLVGKRKYHKGKKRAMQQWVFGGIQRDSKKCFAVRVVARDAKTLVPIIEKYVKSGTTIYSDCWKAYSCLGKKGYNHLTVNHKVTFKDGDVCTNKVEGIWKHLKDGFAKTNRKKELFDGYIREFMFRRKYDDGDIFDAFLSKVSLVYPPLVKDNIAEEEDSDSD